MQTIVSAVQYCPKLLSVRENITTALRLTHEAAAKGARVIVLPELAISGFVINSQREAFDVCQQRNGFQTQAFQPIAQAYGCHIVLGYVELLENHLYNSAVTIGPAGVVANAQKHNLYGSDSLWATPSEMMPSIAITEAGRLGTLICRDASNNYRESYKFHRPEYRFYKKGDVDTICLPTNWGSGYGYPDSSWLELAESTEANVIVSNRIGKERDMKFKGGSMICSKDGRLWTHGSSFTEECVVGGMVIV